MPFIANTDDQRREMLATLGLSGADLFADIPDHLRCGSPDIPEGISEQQAAQRVGDLAGMNDTDLTSFLGGGFYDHYIPAAVPAIVGRSEFYTSYTPYQPEASQGTLQAIYEYQSAICRLTGMEISNASMYDGGTALYEAVMMALRITRREHVVVDRSVSVIYRTILRSYTTNLGIELDETAPDNGLPDRRAIGDILANGETAAVVVQNPNFFGCMDEFTDLAEMCHEHGALLIVSAYPIALGLLKSPGDMGADIVTGEGQSLGMPLNFGGPYLGFMATRKKHMRKMPGRIAGRTVDQNGKDCFVLTLQAREQHIRREKATSNICTNQGLCALTAIAYLSLLGKEGLRKVAQNCAEKAWYAQQELLTIPGVELRFPNRWYFNEFVLELPTRADRVIRRLLRDDIAAGFPLARYYPNMDNALMVAVTEKRTKREIDFLVHSLENAL
ncbi:MAG: aminomethyl-transferring glycine dehydrogenase subunit GcvPA [Planctomycetes bacterium]|jgi:glycine dehydrogenase subunit 1|nr:aminomethyl-transferring glycine dehydrogenase subunit GcvPA [Phycisphaerae bacterium]NBB94606.1 aminomethyl-transferring glycine dehydrogenase subunit GcvPA [Planctomycetota bacterium]